jgi:hypothetical protein
MAEPILLQTLEYRDIFIGDTITLSKEASQILEIQRKKDARKLKKNMEKIVNRNVNEIGGVKK